MYHMDAGGDFYEFQRDKAGEMKMDKFSELKAAAMAQLRGRGNRYTTTGATVVLFENSEETEWWLSRKSKVVARRPDMTKPFSSEQQANTAFIAAANPAVVLRTAC